MPGTDPHPDAPNAAGFASRPAPLTGKQRSALRAHGHHLRPILHIGHGGVSDATNLALRAALDHHELIKIRILDTSPLSARDTAAAAASLCGAQVVQVLGRNALLFLAREENSAFRLP